MFYRLSQPGALVLSLLEGKEFFHEEEKQRQEEQSALTPVMATFYLQSLTGASKLISLAWEDVVTPAPSRTPVGLVWWLRL